MARATYSVIVGNIGTVLSDATQRAALATFAEYVAQSKTGRGRAGDESVYIMRRAGDDESIFREYNGPRDSAEFSD